MMRRTLHRLEMRLRMSGTWWFAGFAALAGMSVVVAACGGGGGTNSSQTPQGTTTAVNSKPTPFATAVIVGNQFTSVKGYTVTFPNGWHARSNFVNTADGTIDAFFEPVDPQAPPTQGQANISVQCLVYKAPTPEQFLTDSETRTARLPQDKDITVSQSKVGGLDAVQLAYRFESSQDPSAPKIEKRDLIFSNDKCDWTVTLTTPAGQYDKYKPAFDGFLSTFKLT
jgi:hypothetical protein